MRILVILVLCFAVCFARHDHDNTISKINRNVSTTTTRRPFLSFLFGSEPFQFIKNSLSKIFRRRRPKTTTITTTTAITEPYSEWKPTTKRHEKKTVETFPWVKVLKTTFGQFRDMEGSREGYIHDRFSFLSKIPPVESKSESAPFIPYTRHHLYPSKQATFGYEPRRYEQKDERGIGNITDAPARVYTFTPWRTKSRYYNTPPPPVGSVQNQHYPNTLVPRFDYHASTTRYRAPRTFRTNQEHYYTRKMDTRRHTTRRYEQPYESYYRKQDVMYPQTHHTTESNKLVESVSTDKVIKAHLESSHKETSPTHEIHSQHSSHKETHTVVRTYWQPIALRERETSPTGRIDSQPSSHRETHTASRTESQSSSDRETHAVGRTESRSSSNKETYPKNTTHSLYNSSKEIHPASRTHSQHSLHREAHITDKPESHHIDRKKDRVPKHDRLTHDYSKYHFHTKYTSPSTSTLWHDVPVSRWYPVQHDVPSMASGKQEKRFTFLHRYGKTIDKSRTNDNTDEANSLLEELEYNSISRSIEVDLPDVSGISDYLKYASKKRAVVDNYLRGVKSVESKESRSGPNDDKGDLSYWYYFTGTVPDVNDLVLVRRKYVKTMQPLLRKVWNPDFFRKFIVTRYYSKLYEDVKIRRTTPRHTSRSTVHETTRTRYPEPKETTIPTFPTYIEDTPKNIDPYGLLRKIMHYNQIRRPLFRNGTRDVPNSRLHPLNQLPPYFNLPYTLPMRQLLFTDDPVDQKFTILGKYRMHKNYKTLECVQFHNEFSKSFAPPTQSGFYRVMQRYRISENKTIEKLGDSRNSSGGVVPYEKDRTIAVEIRFYPLRTQPTPFLMREDMSVLP